jgi:hypothetical protein
MGARNLRLGGTQWLPLLAALCGCAKELPPLPPADNLDGASRRPLLESAPLAGGAGALVYRGVRAGVTTAEKRPSCTGQGAPYPGQVESILLRSARTPFIRFEVDGYVRSCVDHTKVETYAGESWNGVASGPPRGPATSLDGTLLGSELCDVVSCMKIGHPLCVPLVEFQRVDAQTNAYESRALRGEVRVHFPYYADSDCHSAKVAVHRVLL